MNNRTRVESLDTFSLDIYGFAYFCVNAINRMAIEIERKFLLKNNNWLEAAEGQVLIQGYLSLDKERTVRIRVVGDKAFLTIKGVTVNTTRKEFEYEIPLNDGMKMLELCHRPIIEKTRYNIDFDGHTWEIDVFEGENKGLVVAEIELSDENESFTMPEWIGLEVSNDSRYYNANLIQNPFRNW